MSGGEDLDAIFFLPVASHFEMFRGYRMRRKRNNAAWKYKEDYEIHENFLSQLIMKQQRNNRNNSNFHTIYVFELQVFPSRWETLGKP